MGNGTGHALCQRAHYQRVQKAHQSRRQKIDQESGTESLGRLVERLGQGAHHPETEHGAGELKGQIDFIVRMRVTDVTRLFRPGSDEKPEESDVHKSPREPHSLVQVRRSVWSRCAEADWSRVPDSPVESEENKGKQYADDCRAHEEIVPMRILDPVQGITKSGDDLIQSVVDPGPWPEKVDQRFEMELAFVSELGKEADRGRGKQ